jgi:hypothetical protein
MISVFALSLIIMTTVQADNHSSGIKLRGPGSVQPVTKEAASREPIRFKVNYVYRPGGKGELRPLEDGSVLNSGDHYKIQFTPLENGYVYIFQIDSGDTVYQLFPMDEWGGVVLNNFNPVKANKTYSLPADGKSFVLDDQKGLETIYFLASRNDDPNIKKLAEQLYDARQQNNKQLDTMAQRGLKQSFKTRGPAKVVSDSSAKAEVSWPDGKTAEVPQQNMECTNCVNEVTFTHQ